MDLHQNAENRKTKCHQNRHQLFLLNAQSCRESLCRCVHGELMGSPLIKPKSRLGSKLGVDSTLGPNTSSSHTSTCSPLLGKTWDAELNKKWAAWATRLLSESFATAAWLPVRSP